VLALALIPLTVPEVLAWSRWRRRHQALARRCHYRRRLARLAARNLQL